MPPTLEQWTPASDTIVKLNFEKESNSFLFNKGSAQHLASYSTAPAHCMEINVLGTTPGKGPAAKVQTAGVQSQARVMCQSQGSVLPWSGLPRRQGGIPRWQDQKPQGRSAVWFT